MISESCKICGGCPLRSMDETEYREYKTADFVRTTERIKQSVSKIDTPIFVADGNRRRADMKFRFQKGKLTFGFNEEESHNLVDIHTCPMLTPMLNSFIPHMRNFLAEFCQIKYTVKNKKKLENKSIREGGVKFLQADNGIDILLSFADNPDLEHRLLVADFVNAETDVVRLSWKVGTQLPETIVEKTPPLLYIADYAVAVPQGSFLQASKSSETAMITKVLEYIGDTTGKIADLFCGLGTFTYPLAQNNQNEILSVDSYEPSLHGLRQALNQNQIHNVKILNRNLFKYPLDADELAGIKVLVMDPPRAGAHEQCRAISELSPSVKPEKIIFVSCNPKTFVYDADLLISSNYTLENITLIDQFVYSKHQELIALFTLNR